MRGHRFINLFGGVRAPAWVLPGASVDLDFANNRYFGAPLASLVSIARATSKTDLLLSSASGAAFTTFGANTPAITPGKGLLIEEARTNLFLNSGAPVTQTIALPATGSYVLWVNGAGSAAIAAGTATITGAGAATNGTPVTINATVAGTVTVTITGALNAVQLEAGAFGTSYIPTAGASATRNADDITATGSLNATLQGAQGAVVASLGATANNTFPLPSVYQNNRELITIASGTTAKMYNGTADLVAALGSGSFSLGAVKTAASWNVARRAIVANNGAVATEAATPGPVSGSYTLGGITSFRYHDGYFARLSCWNTQLADATLKNLTI